MPEPDDLKNAISDLRVELVDRLDKNVNDKFDRAAELLRLTIGSALKILGGAVLLLVVVVTVLGIRTIDDIDSAIRKIAGEKVETELKEYNPTAAFQRRVDGLYDQALIDSYLIAAERTKTERFPSARIESSDVQRLLSILRNPQSDLKRFRNAATVLRKLSSASSWASIGKEYEKLVEASEDEYAFLKTDVRRRAVLITQLGARHYGGSGTTMKSIAGDSDQHDRLRVVAAKYLVKKGDLNATQLFERLAVSPIPELRSAGLAGLARVWPKNPKLKGWVEEYDLASSDRFPEVHLALNIVERLMEGNPRYGGLFGTEDPNKEVAMKTAKKILRKIFATDMGFFFEYVRK